MALLTGGCLCGAVRYRLYSQPYHVTHCHCKSCRKGSGAAFVTWFTIEESAVEWLGESLSYYRSSVAVERGFCSCCGSSLTYRHQADPMEVDITAASLDNPEWVRPEFHTWWEQHIAWGEADVQGTLPVHQRMYTESHD